MLASLFIVLASIGKAAQKLKGKTSNESCNERGITGTKLQ